MKPMASTPLSDFDLTLPLVAAPMAGGASTPALVIAAARAGAIGLLAAGYQGPAALAEQIEVVRGAGVPFGVNLFAPNPLPVDRAAFRRYAHAIQTDAEPYDLDLLGGDPIEDDDGWQAKLDLLLADPVPLVSFTFAIPDPRTIAALRGAGTIVLQTVTSAAEAKAATEAGVDMLAVQSFTAGGHWGTMTPEQPPPAIPLRDLVTRISSATNLPLIAAGGLSSARQVGAIIGAGATAAMLGTALLLADESGASAVHKAALSDPARRETVMTRAFTGRPARGLRNGFIDRHAAEAPFGYPAIHNLTSPLRKLAAEAGDPELVHLWAGTGYRDARAEPLAQLLTRLSAFG
jgi:nitronate monooxygenase